MSRSHPPGMALPESRARTSPRKCATRRSENLTSPRSFRTPFALSDAPPLQLRQELPLSTISQIDARNIDWSNAPKYEGRVYSDIVTFRTKCKKAEVVHRVFIGDYVKIHDASDKKLYMVTGVTWFPLAAKKRCAEQPDPGVLFSFLFPRTQCQLSFAGARGGPRRRFAHGPHRQCAQVRTVR